MIDRFDEVYELIGHQAVGFERAFRCLSGRSGVDIKTMIDQNRKMMQKKKQLQLRVIRARRLKVKVDQILNINKKQFLRSHADLNIRMGVYKMDQEVKQNNWLIRNKEFLRQGIRKGIVILKKKQDRIKSNTNNKAAEYSQLGESYNIFQNFNDEELGMIESDLQYFLKGEENVELFKRFMSKKRAMRKDRSYERFMLKTRSRQQSDRADSVQTFKRFREKMFKTLGSSRATEKNDMHLLTNPINFQNEKKYGSVVPAKSLIEQTRKLMKQLQERQVMNKQRLDRLEQKKKLDLRISANYAFGVAAQRRAALLDEKSKAIKRRNQMENRKSANCRERVKTLTSDYGDTVVIAQVMRTQMLRNYSTRQLAKR